MGDREHLLDKAIQKMQELWGVLPHSSNRYNTPAWGMPESTPDFLNQVVMFTWVTPPAPESIMRSLLEIEKELGRSRIEKNAGYVSRTMDLDLLAIEGVVCNTTDLILPHPRMHLRKFVLLPMAELAGDVRSAPDRPTVNELLSTCPDVSSVQLWPSPGL